MIFSHENEAYKEKWNRLGANRWNGAYFYSKEIVERIIPNVNTSRNWVTVNIKGMCADHSIVFIHNNNRPQNYEWLSRYKDLILVCGVPSTVEKVAHLGKAIYIPISIDRAFVEQFKTKKTKGTAYVGRQPKRKDMKFDDDVDFIEGLPRVELLKRMAMYKNIYAVGRTALEGKVLGCNILPFDERYPDTSLWKAYDNLTMAKRLQKAVDEIDS